MNKSLKSQLKTVFDAPEPQRKQKFLNEIPSPRTGLFDFFWRQVGYIRKSYWVISAIILAAVIYISVDQQLPIPALGLISSILPILSLTGIREISKSMSYQMEELEMSCRHDFSRIILVRLTIIGIIYLIVLGTAVVILPSDGGYGMLRTGLYALTPFLLSCCGSLLAINYLQTRETSFICGCVTFFICILNMILNSQISNAFADNYLAVWIMIFVLAACLILVEIKKLINRTEELHWNSLLTD